MHASARQPPARPRHTYGLARLRAGLKPFRLHFFPRLRSTNDHAAALRRRGELFAPAVVVTPHQLAGRGRGDNTWFSTAQTLTVTFAMPVEEHLAAHQLPLIAGLAVRAAAQELLAASLARQAARHGVGQSLRIPEVQLKWPNDVLHVGRKLAGLLCERIDKVDLIGIGLNVNLEPAEAPPALREKVTSLSALAGETFDLTEVLIVVARHAAEHLGQAELTRDLWNVAAAPPS
jgi:BirA family biotin operon repressor/biotin-[acetyl-CoA-carboxylase] ligase